MSLRRALVAEDSLMILMGLELLLEQHQVHIVGPASTVDEALALAEEGDFDIALLDINLHNRLSYPVAERLQTRGVPVIFISAYMPSTLPAHLRGTPFVQKPYEISTLMALVEQAFSRVALPQD